jgi:hypothetical protein
MAKTKRALYFPPLAMKFTERKRIQTASVYGHWGRMGRKQGTRWEKQNTPFTRFSPFLPMQEL